MRLGGLGLEHEAGSEIGSPGDHIVRVKVAMPEKLSLEEESLYKRLKELE